MTITIVYETRVKKGIVRDKVVGVIEIQSEILREDIRSLVRVEVTRKHKRDER